MNFEERKKELLEKMNRSKGKSDKKIKIVKVDNKVIVTKIEV